MQFIRTSRRQLIMNAEIEENVRKNVPWAQLPAHVKQVGRELVSCCYLIIFVLSRSQVLGNTYKEYDKSIINFSIRNQLRYRGNLG